jgi:hypothetical protein
MKAGKMQFPGRIQTKMKKKLIFDQSHCTLVPIFAA